MIPAVTTPITQPRAMWRRKSDEIAIRTGEPGYSNRVVNAPAPIMKTISPTASLR